ncbi:MAG: glycosyltransferase family 2 protein [Candidatus Omnitrophica bacterium]|nr:glycosyltransferase family 2 protein [Candidatus Omnitrophota bacterium]
MNPRVLVIIPAFNESGAIINITREVIACGVQADVLVIDDGSVDDTAARAKSAGALVVRLPFNLGIGGAVQAGYRYAKANGYDIAVQVDGDGQHDPAYLKHVILPVLAGSADMAIGSRFIDGKSGFRSSAIRRVGIRFFSFLIRLLSGVNVTDPTSGFRACGRRLIDVFAAYYPQDYPEPEAVVVARRLHCRVTEVSVVMRARTSGASSISFVKSFYYMIKVSSAILLHTLKDRKVYQP